MGNIQQTILHKNPWNCKTYSFEKEILRNILVPEFLCLQNKVTMMLKYLNDKTQQMWDMDTENLRVRLKFVWGTRHMANAQSIIVFGPNLLDSCSLSTLFLTGKLKVRPGVNTLDPWHLLRWYPPLYEPLRLQVSDSKSRVASCKY